MLFLICYLFTGPTVGTWVPEAHWGNEEVAFGAGITLVPDDTGALYVLDPAAYRVRIFDDSGRETGGFGGRGKGPGEFEEPKALAATPEGLLGVFDPTLKRLTLFNARGEVVGITRLDAATVSLYQPVFLAENRFAYLGARAHEGKPVYDLSVFEADTVVSHLLRYSVPPLDWRRQDDPAFWVDFLQNELALADAGLPVVCTLDADTLVYARTDAPTLTFCDARGRALGQLVHEVKPAVLTQAARAAVFERIWERLITDPFVFRHMPRRILERASARVAGPETLPLIHALTAHGGDLGVWHGYDPARQQGRFDLIDRQGRVKATAAWQGGADLLVGHERKLFAVGMNKTGDVVITRYDLKLQ